MTLLLLLYIIYIIIIMSYARNKNCYKCHHIPFKSAIETITECIINFKYVEIVLSKYLITLRYDLYHEYQ